MDPLAQLRGDVPHLDPLTRARLAGQAAEDREWRQAEADREAAVERFQANLAQQAAVERSELMAQGYTTRELREHQQQADALRQERVAELEAELAKLDPARRANARRSQSDVDAAVLLARARQAGDSPFMRKEVAELERREQRRRDEIERARLERLEESYRPPDALSWPVIRR